MATSKNATFTAERIRKKFKKEAFSPAPDQSAHMTVSIGLAKYKKKEDITVFVDRVDQLMYQAKKNGKDCVYCE
jgi:diguanylate cyclase (GGDEF)-like protein